MQTVLPISANEITERLKNGAILIDIRQKDEYLRENITQASSFYSLSAFVGVGLIFAGVTGFCGMAKLLAKMPWNKV